MTKRRGVQVKGFFKEQWWSESLAVWSGTMHKTGEHYAQGWRPWATRGEATCGLRLVGSIACRPSSLFSSPPLRETPACSPALPVPSPLACINTIIRVLKVALGIWDKILHSQVPLDNSSRENLTTCGPCAMASLFSSSSCSTLSSAVSHRLHKASLSDTVLRIDVALLAFCWGATIWQT
jgi:hypothetical protein